MKILARQERLEVMHTGRGQQLCVVIVYTLSTSLTMPDIGMSASGFQYFPLWLLPALTNTTLITPTLVTSSLPTLALAVAALATPALATTTWGTLAVVVSDLSHHLESFIIHIPHHPCTIISPMLPLFTHPCCHTKYSSP